MPTPDRPPLTRAVVLRGIGFAAAIALGAVAVWLTVTSDSQKSLRIGMLVGLWGLLLGAYSMFGARRGMGVEATDDPGREIALRESRSVERSDDGDARRDWEARLERLITREISTAVGRETAALRNEIAHLRQELVDKVGGQLRLERIETTRVIGSDLSALQDEVRQLKDASGSPSVRELLINSSDPRVAVRPVVEPARVRPVSRSTAEVEADVRPAVRPIEPVDAAAQQPARPEPAADRSEKRPEGPQLRPAQQPARPAQAPAAPAAESPQRPPISHAAAQAAQSRAAGAAASQLGGPRRGETTPPAAQSHAGSRGAPLRPAAPVAPTAAPAVTPATPPATERPTDAAARVHRAPSQQPAAKQAPPRENAPTMRPAATEQAAATPPARQPQQPQPQQPQQRPRQAPQQPAAAAAPKPPAAEPADPFASLPRLSRFTDFELDPIGNGDASTGNGNGRGNGNGHRGGNGDPSARQDPAYTGRRRHAADDAEGVEGVEGVEGAERAGTAAGEARAATELAGKHANGTSPAARSGGRRRRRDDDDDDEGSELLARLLARETSGR